MKHNVTKNDEESILLDMEEETEKVGKCAPIRYYDHAMGTHRAFDGILDTKEKVTIFMMRAMELLKKEEWITNIEVVMEWNLPEWYPETWMHFWHYHFHFFMIFAIAASKSVIRQKIKNILKNVWYENKFNKGWIVFGQTGVRQKSSYQNYLAKSGNEVMIIKGDGARFNGGKRFDYEKVGKFQYGTNFDDKLSSTIRVILNQFIKYGYTWTKEHGTYVYKIQGETLSPAYVMRIFATKLKYRVFWNKLNRYITSVIQNPQMYLTDCVE